jgi:AsmA protein
MKKTLKIILWIILAFIILLGVGALALVKFVDPNDFKPQIVAAVNSATGRQLTLTGKLSWSFYPEVGIHVGAASLSNPPGFSQNIFAQIDSANLAISFWELMQGNINFSELNLNGLKVYLIQNQNRNNWTFSTNSPQTATNNTKSTSSATTGKSLNIEAISINDGEIIFDDNQTKSHYALENINLNANNVGLNHTFPITLATNYNINQNITGSLKVNTKINFNQKTQKLLLEDLGVATNINYPTTNNKLLLNSNISGDIAVNFNNQTINTKQLNFALNQILKGQITNLQVNNFTNPKFSGNLSTAVFSLKDLLNSIGITDIAIANKTILNQSNLQTQFTGTTNSLNLNNIIFNLGASQLKGTINISSFMPMSLSENLILNQLDVADYVNIKGARLPMQGITSNGTLHASSRATYPRALNGNINLKIQSIILKGFDLNALIKSLGDTANSLKNLQQAAVATSQVQQQMQQLMNNSNINPNNGASTDLGALTAQLQIQQGVITTPVMQLQGPTIMARGSGSIDLGAENINYELDATMPSSNNTFIRSLVIPYQIQGNFNNISQGLNWVSLNAQILKYLLVEISKGVQGTVTQVLQQTVKQIQVGGQGAADIGSTAAKALNSLLGGQGN